MIDLHIHSNFSDGTESIDSIESLAKKSNIDILSITDHDSIESAKVLDTRNNELLFIPGVEISTVSYYYNEKQKVHLLGYGYNHNNKDLNKMLDELQIRRSNDHHEYIEDLIKIFPFLSNEMFKNFPYGKYGWIHRMITDSLEGKLDQTELNQLVEYVKKNKPTYHSYFISLEEALETINKSNAYSILAHPFELNMPDNKLREFVKYLKSIGLNGIETYHNDSTRKDREISHILALEYDLLESGGSDFHRLENNQKLGCIHEEMSNSSEIVKKLVYKR